MSLKENIDKALKGRPLATDPAAVSKSPTEPAFISPPEETPVYHGFPVLQDVAIDGFTLEKITDFETEASAEGDAFVIAPDNSRAGLVWEVSKNNNFREVRESESGRWGVWEVSFPHPMNSRDNARKNLEFILPSLKQKWEEWRSLRKI